MIPIMFETMMNMNSENTASDGIGHEFVAQLRHRLKASGHQLPSGDAADHQQRNQRYRDEHVGR
jgi:hypothetical protein